ncbi:MAG: hypothetical protein KGJ37_04845 [Verrucomicrobiota bacterium]|nr:hypothetical protein [Verrucomicrobiota bacterium]
MESQHPIRFQTLDEDLQIVRATLAAISGDVGNFSGKAGHAVAEALEKLDRAQEEFVRSRKIRRDGRKAMTPGE